MMTVGDLQGALRKQPFTPVRLYVSDGGHYDVHHPELCMAGLTSVLVGMPKAGSAEPVYERYAIVDLAHITRIEPLPVSAKPKKNGPA